MITGRQLVRVFWAWFNPKSDGKVTWEAPSNPRWSFGNSRALYKMYFTSTMRDPAETTEQSSCVRFAREFMPVVEDVLSKIQAGEKVDSPATEPKAEAVATAEETAGDASATPESADATPETPAATGDSAASATDPTATEPAAEPAAK